MASNFRIPNPLKAADDVWKKAAGPTQRVPSPAVKQGPPIRLASGKPKKRLRKKSSIPEGKI